MPRKNTLETLIDMKKEVLNTCISKQLKSIEGAKLLKMHPKSFLRLKYLYIKHGDKILIPKPPGPKRDSLTCNRTPKWIEDIVCNLACNNSNSGPVELSEKLLDRYNIKLHSVTIYRILKRNYIRYNLKHTKVTKQPAKLYCLETPGEELQLDACYPFGRGRQLCCFDAIDDCSRMVLAKIYNRETSDNAVDFIKHLIKVSPYTIKRIRIDNRSKNKIQEFCESVGIEVIVNIAYQPKQNGKIERFHKTIKTEFFWKHCGFYEDINSINYKLQQWLIYYNEKRRHGGYGMNRLTPLQKLTGSMFNSLYILPPEKVTLTMQLYKTRQNTNIMLV